MSDGGKPIANAIIHVRNDTSGRDIDHDITSGELPKYSPTYLSMIAAITSAKEDMFSSLLFVCQIATLRINLQTDLHEIFREGWQWDNEQMFKCYWKSGSPSGYRDCFPDSSLLEDTESG